MNNKTVRDMVDRSLRKLDTSEVFDREVLNIYSCVMSSIESLGEEGNNPLTADLYASSDKFFIVYSNSEEKEGEFKYSYNEEELPLILHHFVEIVENIQLELLDELTKPFFSVYEFNEEKRVKEGKYKGCYKIKIEINLFQTDESSVNQVNAEN